MYKYHRYRKYRYRKYVFYRPISRHRPIHYFIFYIDDDPMGMAFSWRGCSLPTISPQLGEDPPVEDPGLCDPPGKPGWLSW